jgi:hypothetical protein
MNYLRGLLVICLFSSSFSWPVAPLNDGLYPATAFLKNGKTLQGHGYFITPRNLPAPKKRVSGPIFVLDGVKIRNVETDSLVLNFVPGYPDSVGWRFKIVDGTIKAYTYEPNWLVDGQVHGEIINWLQKGNSPSVPFSKDALVAMISDCETAKIYYKLSFIGSYCDSRQAILEYNCNFNSRPDTLLALFKAYVRSGNVTPTNRLAQAFYEYDYSNRINQYYPQINVCIYKKDGTCQKGFGLALTRLTPDELVSKKTGAIVGGIAIAVIEAFIGGGLQAAALGGEVLQVGSSLQDMSLYKVVYSLPQGDRYIKGPNILIQQSVPSRCKVIYMNRTEIKPEMVDSVMINNYIGIPDDTFYVFKVIDGRIAAYSRYPVPYVTSFCALQKDNGPIVPFTIGVLDSMINDNECSRILRKTKREDSLQYYYAIREYNHPQNAYRSQLDSLKQLLSSIENGTHAYELVKSQYLQLSQKAVAMTGLEYFEAITQKGKNPEQIYT